MDYEEMREVPPYRGKIKPEFIVKARKAYQQYKADKEKLDVRITQNNKWYKSRYGRMVNPKTNETEPATAFIFSAIESNGCCSFLCKNIIFSNRKKTIKNIDLFLSLC